VAEGLRLWGTENKLGAEEWSQDNWGVKIRVGLSLALLVGGKVGFLSGRGVHERRES
jgi:hypothetical protein